MTQSYTLTQTADFVETFNLTIDKLTTRITEPDPNKILYIDHTEKLSVFCFTYGAASQREKIEWGIVAKCFQGLFFSQNSIAWDLFPQLRSEICQALNKFIIFKQAVTPSSPPRSPTKISPRKRAASETSHKYQAPPSTSKRSS